MTKNSGESWRQFLYFSFTAIVVAVVGLLIATAYSVVFQDVPIHDESIDDATFALILSGVTIAFASSVIIPPLALRRAVDEQVRHAVEEIQKGTKASYEASLTLIKEDHMARLKLIESTHKKNIGALERGLQSETLKIDAHLSRMIAYLLLEKKKVWALGWVLRSAQRYYSLRPTGGLRKYKDLLNLLAEHAGDVVRALRPKPGETRDDFTPRILSTESEAARRRDMRTLIRLVKDYFDLETRVFDEVKAKEPLMRSDGRQVVQLDPDLEPLVTILRTGQNFISAILVVVVTESDADALEVARLITEISSSDAHKEELRQLLTDMEVDKEQEAIFARFDEQEDPEVLGFILHPKDPKTKLTYSGGD